MTIEELVKKDSTFSKSSFIAKVDNTFIMLLTSIMTNNMSRVKHKIDDRLFNKYYNYVDELNKKNQRQMYDELNVKSSTITNITEDDNNYIINVKLISRYMDYIVDKTNFKIISGNNKSRVEKENTLIFKKIKNAKNESIAKKCPGCGANVNTNNNGICSYCGTAYNTYNYDWILEEIA